METLIPLIPVTGGGGGGGQNGKREPQIMYQAEINDLFLEGGGTLVLKAPLPNLNGSVLPY